MAGVEEEVRFHAIDGDARDPEDGGALLGCPDCSVGLRGGGVEP